MRVAGVLPSVLCAVLAAGCMHQGATRFDDPSAIAVLDPTEESTLRGVVDFVRKDKLVLVTASLSGAAPNSTHGMHIHEVGDCTARDASSAGDHFNPTNAEHGGPAGMKRHGGDLGNMTANERGEINATVEVDGLAFGTGPDSIIGRALIVHANADDLQTQPSGNSGARLACGVITRNADRRTYATAR
jgi:Cu-Zn family superoxide dismutase